MNSNTTPSSKLDQQQQQEPAAGSSSHSFTDTIKGYVHTAMTKGQEAIHKAQEQISHATHPQKNQQTHSQQQQQQQTATTTAVASNNDAFADVNQFNANADQQQPPAATEQSSTEAAGHSGIKSSQNLL